MCACLWGALLARTSAWPRVSLGAASELFSDVSSLCGAWVSRLRMLTARCALQAMSIVKEGWVIKCGGSIKTWKKRWLVLRGNTLYYFKKKEDTQEQGSIRLEPGMVRRCRCRRRCWCCTADGGVGSACARRRTARSRRLPLWWRRPAALISCIRPTSRHKRTAPGVRLQSVSASRCADCAATRRARH